MDIEGGYSCLSNEDHVYVYDGADDTARRMVKLCRQYTTVTVSSSNYMFVSLYTDDGGSSGNGFSMTYTATDRCKYQQLYIFLRLVLQLKAKHL